MKLKQTLFVITALFTFACGGGSDDAEKATAAVSSGDVPLIPDSLRGAYEITEKKNEYSEYKREFTVTATGVSGIDHSFTSDSGSITITKGKVDGDNTYIIQDSTYSGKGCYSGPCKCAGSISLKGGTIVSSLAGHKGCAEILSGTYNKKAATAAPAPAPEAKPKGPQDPIPQKMRKKWYDHGKAEKRWGEGVKDGLVRLASKSISWTTDNNDTLVITNVTGTYKDGIFELATGELNGNSCSGMIEEAGEELVVALKCPISEKAVSDDVTMAVKAIGSFKWTSINFNLTPNAKK